MRKNINYGEDEEFIKNYDELKSSRKMAKLYNCDKKSILKHAKEIGYVCKTRTYKLSEQDKKEIIEKYDIESSAKLSEQYNVSRGMITKLWWDNNLYGKRRWVYPFDENYFEKIDLDEKAYWLGFLIADGNVYKPEGGRQGLISITLQRGDEKHLEKFKAAIKSEKPLSNYTRLSDGAEYSSIQLSSQKMFDDLCKFGCVPRKTYENIWVDLDNDKLQGAFIRGFFDGDGTISKHFEINTLHRINVGIIGFNRNLEKFKNYLDGIGLHGSIVIDRARNYDNGESFGELRFTNKKTVYDFLNFIYPTDCPVYLERKYLLAEEYKRLYILNSRSWTIKYKTNADNKSGKIGESPQTDLGNTEVS